jgi:hypothetical protein
MSPAKRPGSSRIATRTFRNIPNMARNPETEYERLCCLTQLFSASEAGIDFAKWS